MKDITGYKSRILEDLGSVATKFRTKASKIISSVNDGSLDKSEYPTSELHAKLITNGLIDIARKIEREEYAPVST